MAAATTTMSQPPPPTGRRPPPPITSTNTNNKARNNLNGNGNRPKPPTPSRGASRPRPPPPSTSLTKKRPAPPPRPSTVPSPSTSPLPSLNTEMSKVAVTNDATTTTTVSSLLRKDNKIRRKVGPISIKKPVDLRDVCVYDRKHKVGQGTYGSVFMGADKETGEIVALKRINTKQEDNGFPITAIREVKILKALEHENIVKLIEIVTSKEQNGQNEMIPRNVYMVFEYHEYDLTGILQSPEIRLTQDQIKSWSYQLLEGTHYMHLNKIIHRDLKASNILISKSGQLKIADWGLARSWNAEMKNLTNGVVTRWYRPIELLLGAKEYSPKIDMWSVGCIIAEMFRRDGLLKGGDSEASQLNLIFQTCGHPDVNTWPDIRRMCPLWRSFEPAPDEKLLPNRLAKVLTQRLPNPKWMTDKAVELIQNLLTHNPEKRWSASEGLHADYFWETPTVKKAHELSMRLGVDHVHELKIREKHESNRAAIRNKQIPPARS